MYMDCIIGTKDIKPMRLPVGGRISRKRYLTIEQAGRLLEGRVAIEEKLDGKPQVFDVLHYRIFAEDMKIKHSIGYRVPARYAVYDIFDKTRQSLLGIEGKLEVYKEMKNSPAFFRQGATVSINWGNVYGMIGAPSFFLAKIIEVGKFSLEDLTDFIGYSDYGKVPNTWMEGIVVKDVVDFFVFQTFEERSGKIVRSEFIDDIGKHYLRKKEERNEINPRIKEVNPILDNYFGAPKELEYAVLVQN